MSGDNKFSLSGRDYPLHVDNFPVVQVVYLHQFNIASWSSMDSIDDSFIDYYVPQLQSLGSVEGAYLNIYLLFNDDLMI